MFVEIKKHGAVDKKTRKEHAAEIEAALRPIAQVNGGLQVFGVIDNGDTLTTITAIESETAPTSLMARDAGALVLEENTVTKIPGRIRPRPKPKPKPRRTRGSRR